MPLLSLLNAIGYDFRKLAQVSLIHPNPATGMEYGRIITI
ncbi:hypothetical protein HMPREF3038_02476 [Akkermansia sp. KLE1797]|nr:hypothetical protein HMPREF3038_02476 [Akkermansia sp. KLE1797]KXU54791.1 hypothetical protein HMPREF3039_00938 [Akkermansia sp. KLE1798]KZA06179.1 hypothetical protein HMPREF1326_00027 [Akkermansia sp. KLE1605]